MTSFEEFRGQQVRGNIRGSTQDQKDGIGPDVQRKSIITYAEKYGLQFDGIFCGDYIAGWSVKRRVDIARMVEDRK